MVKIDQKKIIEYGIYIFSFLLPWQGRLILKSGSIDKYFLEYLTYSLFAIDVILVLLLIFFLISQFREIKKIEEPKKIPLIIWLIGGLELSIFISIFFSLNNVLALYHYFVFLLGVGVFWLLFKAEYKKKKLIYFFLGNIFFQSLLAIWQFLSQSSFSSKWLGMAGHNPRDLGVSVIEAIGKDGIGERWLRAYGSLDHPNILGGVLSIALLLLLGIYLNNIQKKSPNQELSKNQIFKYENTFLIITYLLGLVALLFTFSRSAWLGLIGGMVVLIAMLILRKDFFKLKELFIVIIFSLILGVLVFSQYSLLFKTRFNVSSNLENKSILERTASIKDSLPIIRANFWGVGIGNYSLALKEAIPDQNGWYYQPVHNTYLLIWAEAGLFGFLFFSGLVLYLIYINFRKKSILGLPVLLALALMMIFDHWWWSLHFGIFFLFFILGLVVAKTIDKN